MITGRVFGGGFPMPGAAVSNGSDIVQTDREGRYVLRDADAAYPFVFVNLPAGWETEGSFFQRVAGEREYDFYLRAAPHRAADGVRIAHVTDTHLGSSRPGLGGQG